VLRSGPRGRPRPPAVDARSLRREYHEFLVQRIEEYKDSLGRHEILALGDEAVRELDVAVGSQYVLTEVLVLEHVDRIIMKRLRLPSFPRWKRQHRALRDGQRQPTHWDLEPDSLLVDYALRLEAADAVVVIGASWLHAALFLAAHDARVLLLDQDLGAVEAAEQRAVTEQLSGRFEALVLQFGGWFPDCLATFAVVDPGAFAMTPQAARAAALRDLQLRTAPGGVHLVVPPLRTPEVIPIAADSLQRLYADWQIVRRPRTPRGAGFAAIKPESQDDTRTNVSK
jgi:hypothetical protein